MTGLKWLTGQDGCAFTGFEGLFIKVGFDPLMIRQCFETSDVKTGIELVFHKPGAAVHAPGLIKIFNPIDPVRRCTQPLTGKLGPVPRALRSGDLVAPQPRATRLAPVISPP